LAVAGPRILVRFSPRDEGSGSQRSGTSGHDIYSLFDAYSGDQLGDFEDAENAFGAFACYTPDSLTFIGSQAGFMALGRVPLR